MKGNECFISFDLFHLHFCFSQSILEHPEVPVVTLVPVHHIFHLRSTEVQASQVFRITCPIVHQPHMTVHLYLQLLTTLETGEPQKHQVNWTTWKGR